MRVGCNMLYLCVVLVVVGLLTPSCKQKQKPNLPTPSGEKPLDLAALRDGKEFLVILFVLPDCPACELAMAAVQDQQKLWHERVAFVGIMAGDQTTADAFVEKRNLPFPVVGRRTPPKLEGIKGLYDQHTDGPQTRQVINSGTILIIDAQNELKVRIKSESSSLLPSVLTKLMTPETKPATE